MLRTIAPTSPCAEGTAIYAFAMSNKLKRPSLVSQGSITRMLQDAEGALRRMDFQQNLELLERARKLDSANPGILLELGRAHGMRFNYSAAEDCFEKAVQLSDRKSETLIAAAMKSSGFRNQDLTGRYRQRAAEQKDATARTLTQLADFYERVHRHADAAKRIERALQMDPAFPGALLVRALLERQAGHLDEAEKLLRTLLPKADEETRVRAYYQLGAVLDRQGRYDEAMSAFIEAKAPFQSKAWAFSVQRMILSAHYKENLARITADVLQRWFDFGREFQPARRLALLCGHARSGTTLLEQVLDSHPDIVTAEETSVFYEDAYVPLLRAQPPKAPQPGPPPQFQIPVPVELPALEAASADSLRRYRDNYFRSMELCLGQSIAGRLLVDKNPGFQILLFGFQRFFPETKLLIGLRDPRDVCLSCFMTHFGPLAIRQSAFLNLKDTVDEYVEEMTMWRTLAPLMQGHYLEVRYEEMVEDLESVARKTLEFLGVPWDDKVLRYYERAQQKQLRTPSYADVKKPIFKTAAGRWRNYQKYLEPYLEKLEPFVKAFGYE
jgi:tetratricopeptide (TPR) repeat protein